MNGPNKICSKCRVEKNLSEFHKNKSQCKLCRNSSRKKPTGPYKLSEEKQIQFATDLLNGVSIGQASVNVGIQQTTVFLWKKKGILDEFLSEYSLEEEPEEADDEADDEAEPEDVPDLE